MPHTSASPVRIGLIGSGWMGAFHAETISRRLPDAQLVAIADPAPRAAQALTGRLGGTAYTDPAELLADDNVQAVVIASPAHTHAELVVQAAQHGKAVFCEKPMALTLEDADRAIGAARAAALPLQVGFNRRFAADFAAAHEVVASGGIGRVHLLRSLTRDPEFVDPARVKPWTIFLETMIHDFDTLRWLNPGAAVTEVYATADALVRPDWKDRGLLDTSVVLIRFDNGAIATAEASFQAVYGYDIRGEVFGSAGMVTAGELRSTAMTRYGTPGIASDTVRLNVDLFRGAYTAELVHFTQCVSAGTTPQVTGEDARAALMVALACIESVKSAKPVRLDEVERP